MTLNISRKNYADLFGPTTGDRVRLADTDLIIEIEKDLIKYGDESVFGGGKSIRDGMGQASGVSRDESLDLVITNAIILDPVLGIIKADIGVKDGRIVGIGNAGNPNTVLGKNTELNETRFYEYVKNFKEGGATILGGCCEIGPSYIKKISKLKL